MRRRVPDGARRGHARPCRAHLGPTHGADHGAATRVDGRRSRDDPRASTIVGTGVRRRAVSEGSRVLSRPTRTESRNAGSSPSRVSSITRRGSRIAAMVTATRAISCTQRRGVRRVRLRQYARGGEINVWFIPARPTSWGVSGSRFQSCAVTLHPNSSRSTSRWSPKPRRRRTASKSSSPVSDHVRPRRSPPSRRRTHEHRSTSWQGFPTTELPRQRCSGTPVSTVATRFSNPPRASSRDLPPSTRA